MGRRYLSVIDARTNNSLCKFQLPAIPAFPAIGSFALPPLPTLPKFPTVPLFCPLDDAEEVVPTQ